MTDGERSDSAPDSVAADGPTASDGEAPERSWTQVAQRHYDPSLDEELTTTIVFALAAARDVEPGELRSPSLYEVVDAAALEATLFGGHANADDRRGSGTVEFRYDGSLVAVNSDGWVRVFESTTGR